MSFPFSTSTALAEELSNTVCKGLRILPIDADDQRRTLLAAVLNHERDIPEFIRLSIRLELIGDLVGQVVELLRYVADCTLASVEINHSVLLTRQSRFHHRSVRRGRKRSRQ